MMLMELADFDPAVDRRFRWGYSYSEILEFYKRKQKIFFDRFVLTRDCVVELVNTILGGKKKEGEFTKDNGDGLEDLTDEQILGWKEILSEEEFNEMFRDFDLSDLGIDTSGGSAKV